MLNPTSNRLDYGNLLLPPLDHNLEFAVGTSYSLHFDALLGACMALGLEADTDSSLLNNPLYLLETLRRTSDKVLLFCQGGQIHLPPEKTSLYILLEKMVYQVQAPGNYSFHPKFWLLKYLDAKGEAIYRTIILSRNLTFDRSWDTAVSIEGKLTDEPQTRSKPLRDFLLYLAKQIKGRDQNSRDKRKNLRKLADEVAYVSFELNSREFRDFEFIPVGVPKEAGGKYSLAHTNLLTTTFHELLIMSPFLTGSVIREFNNRNNLIQEPKLKLITRRESLARLKSADCYNFKIYTLKDAIIHGEEGLSEEDAVLRKQDIHAKIHLWRRDSQSELYLGSLNATANALKGNIEFVLRLNTTRRWLDLDKLRTDLFGSDEKENPFELTTLPELSESEEDPKYNLEQKLRKVLKSVPKGSVTQDGERYNIHLHFPKLKKEEGITITPLLAPLSFKLQEKVTFAGLTLLQISRFFILNLEEAGENISRIIKIPLENIPEREQGVVQNIVKDTESFFGYIAFLLGEDYLMTALETTHVKKGGFTSARNGEAVFPLYEQMLRTAVNSPAKFKELDYILEMVDQEEVIPAGFLELYKTFLRAVKV